MRGTILSLFFAVLLASSAVASPEFWRHEWPQTDFEKTSVPNWVEILSGGPPKDGIPALDNPIFVRASGKTGIDPTEPVITLEMGGQARAYPIRYLTWHEIVNDTVGGVPVAVTFCPLCNSALTFDRRVKGRVLSFGVSGKLRNSDMIMYDQRNRKLVAAGDW